MDGKTALVDFIGDLAWKDIPEGVRHQAKLCLVDALGATVSGTSTRVSKVACAYAAEAWPGREATVLVHGMKASSAAAAFANGVAANGFDSDDVGKYTKGHPGAQIFPTALAMAEQAGANGSEMLASMVVGYEVAHRAARAWHDHHDVYQACGSWGSVANAAVAAHMMDLDPEAIDNALGIAEYHAPNLPMMRDVDDPAMVKHGIGWGAFTGITAAGLAAQGFTGIPSILHFRRYRDWVVDLGKHYIMAEPGGVLFKEYACCGWAHAALDATRRLVRENRIDASDVTHILVEGFHEMIRLGTSLPTTTEEAQFNLAWPLALLLLDGEVGPQQMLESRLNDEEAIELVSKIEVLESPEYTELAHRMNAGEPGGKYVCDVAITVKDGTTFRSGTTSGGIDFDQAWDETRVKDKFRWLAAQVLPGERVEGILHLVDDLEHLSDISALVELVNVDAGQSGPR